VELRLTGGGYRIGKKGRGEARLQGRKAPLMERKEGKLEGRETTSPKRGKKK